MDYLAIIRHGEFDDGETTLNEKGRIQIASLVPLLKEFHPVIYSSVGPRSIESANLLAKSLDTTSKPLECFGSNIKSLESVYYESAYELLSGSEANVVVVTKGEWANDFITFFSEKALNLKVATVHLERGNGVLIDCKAKTVTPLP